MSPIGHETVANWAIILSRYTMFKMVAEDVAQDPFTHALGQPGIHHPRQGHPERGVLDHILDPSPEV